MLLVPTCLSTYHETMVVVLGEQEIYLFTPATYTEVDGKMSAFVESEGVVLLNSSAPDPDSCLTSRTYYLSRAGHPRRGMKVWQVYDERSRSVSELAELQRGTGSFRQGRNS